jgi:hypothetical protein
MKNCIRIPRMNMLQWYSWANNLSSLEEPFQWKISEAAPQIKKVMDLALKILVKKSEKSQKGPKVENIAWKTVKK